MAKIEYSIRSRDETGQGVKSAQNNLKGFEDTARRVSQTLKLLMGGAALGGLTMAFRRLYNEVAQCEKAFVDLHPETQKAAGSMMQFQKAINESKATFGSLINDIVSPSRSLLIATIQDATKRMTEFGEETETVGEKLGRVGIYTVKVFQTVGRLIYDNFNLFGLTMEALWTLVKAVGETIWLPLKKGFLLIIQPIKQAFIDMVNWVLAQVTTMVNWIGAALEKISGGKIGGALSAFNAGQLTVGNLDPGSVKIVQGWKEIWNTVGGKFDNIVGSLDDIADAYIDIWTRKPSDAKLYELTQPGKAAAIAVSAVANAAQEYNPEGENLVGRYAYEVKQPTALDKLLDAVSPLISSFTSLTMLLNPWQTILQAMITALQPVVDELLAPLVGALTIIGQLFAAIITPALQILGPIIEFVCDIFVFLYNYAILPVANVFISLFNILKAFGTMIYYLITFQWGKLGSINWNPQAGTLTPIDINSLETAGTAAINNQNTGTTSTYSEGRDINVYVTVNSEVIATDGGIRSLALMINREIQNAVALGVA